MTGVCDYCGAETTMTREHMVPRSKGGTDDPDNIAQACSRCNSRKGTNISRWLPCGRASWVGENCIDVRCLPCAPAQLRHEALWLELTRAGLMRRWSERRRAEAIRSAVAKGGSLREVGAAVGLSHMAVKYIAHGRK